MMVAKPCNKLPSHLKNIWCKFITNYCNYNLNKSVCNICKEVHWVFYVYVFVSVVRNL